MALTALQIAQLNKSNKAMQNPSIGTLLASLEGNFEDFDGTTPVVAGTYTADADDATAEAIVIDTGLAGAVGFIVQLYRSDVGIFSDQDVSMAAGVITIANGAATYDVTDGDVVNYIVF